MGKIKSNEYIIDGDVAIGTTNNTREEFYVDLQDLNLVREYCWHVHITQNGYKQLRARIPGENKHILMHALLGCKDYDHIDRNPLNNRRSNLRPATQSQQKLNRGVRVDNKSGVTGVWYVDNNQQRAKRWYAQLIIDKKKILYKSFDTKEEAIIARLQAEADYVGEFAPQKHLFEKYKINLKEIE